MAEGGFGGSYDGGMFSGGETPNFSSVEQQMSIPEEKVQQKLLEKHEKEKAKVEELCQRERMAVSGAVSGPLILTSRSSNPIVFGEFNDSLETKWEKLYADYLTKVIADTLSQNKDFSTKKIMIAAADLPKHPQLREMYKKVFDLKNKKDSKSLEEVKLAIGEIKAILQWCSLTFNESTLNESVGLQTMAPLNVAAREAVAKRGSAALKKYDEAVEAASTQEEKVGIVTEVLIREEVAKKGPEALAQFDKEMKKANSPEQHRMLLMKIAIREELTKKGPEALAQFDKRMEEAITIEDQKAVLIAAIQELNDPKLRALFDEWQFLEMAAAKEKAEEEAARKKAEEEAKKKLQEKPKVEIVSKSVDTKSTVSSTSYAYDQARSAIADSGSTYTLSSDGTLSLPRGFSVKVEVDKKGKYTLVDEKYATGGKVGPFNLKEFPVKAYERFIDGYISKKIRGRLQNPDEISGVPDNQLVTVGKALLGRGEKNGYKVQGEDLKVLDELIESLLVKDKEHPTLNKKVFALYKRVYKNMDDKTLVLSDEAATIRKKLLTAKASNKKYSVSELLGEDKAEG